MEGGMVPCLSALNFVKVSLNSHMSKCPLFLSFSNPSKSSSSHHCQELPLSLISGDGSLQRQRVMLTLKKSTELDALHSWAERKVLSHFFRILKSSPLVLSAKVSHASIRIFYYSSRKKAVKRHRLKWAASSTTKERGGGLLFAWVSGGR